MKIRPGTQCECCYCSYLCSALEMCSLGAGTVARACLHLSRSLTRHGRSVISDSSAPSHAPTLEWAGGLSGPRSSLGDVAFVDSPAERRRQARRGGEVPTERPSACGGPAIPVQPLPRPRPFMATPAAHLLGSVVPSLVCHAFPLTQSFP